MPKISVLVPIYNVEKYLRECVDSILNQTLEDIEIILIDDGGKDSCPQICDEYAKIDNRIKVIHKTNGGYGQACNVGLDNATGEYIAIVESDDYIDSKMYEDLYKIAKEYNSDIVKSCFYDNLQLDGKTFCKKTKWDSDLIPQDRSFNIKECPLFLCYHPSIWSCIYKREFIEKHHIRFIEAPGAGWTDNPFQVQTMILAEKINYTDNAYYYWRKINRFSADALKDYTIPFIRSDEIHKWLEKNNIKDKNVLACIYRRELIYIKTVLAIKKIPDLKNCFKCINLMIERMSKDIIFSNLFTTREKMFYQKCLKTNLYTYFTEQLKTYRKKLISIHINGKKREIILFGKQILAID